MIAGQQGNSQLVFLSKYCNSRSFTLLRARSVMIWRRAG
ncbi:MAG: hypothetical protein RJA24_775 [Pseudomonadota bacterium]